MTLYRPLLGGYPAILEPGQKAQLIATKNDPSQAGQYELGTIQNRDGRVLIADKGKDPRFMSGDTYNLNTHYGLMAGVYVRRTNERVALTLMNPVHPLGEVFMGTFNCDDVLPTTPELVWPDYVKTLPKGHQRNLKEGESAKLFIPGEALMPRVDSFELFTQPPSTQSGPFIHIADLIWTESGWTMSLAEHGTVQPDGPVTAMFGRIFKTHTKQVGIRRLFSIQIPPSAECASRIHGVINLSPQKAEIISEGTHGIYIVTTQGSFSDHMRPHYYWRRGQWAVTEVGAPIKTSTLD